MADELQDIGRFQRAKAIYTDARELGLAAREEFIERWCAGDRTLEKIVRDLLAAELLPMPFESLAEDIRAAQDPPTALRNASEGDAGSWIGRYRLLERLGEGGFGTVFVAEQTEPVKRRVALKLIKLGMDTRQVVARFEQERQALAIMDHPCIAKVLDGGATATGRPYFVMELVKGEPVTEYCDRRKMPIRGRLEISAQICEAIHHAHQKGIIHRDIKPSNVLITTVGDKPLPKVIDFGIAKATSAKLTEKTIFTEMRQLIGTPEYMSPEQAGDTLEDIDTRTDVYSIGVLMYELLTGAPPFDSDRLRSAAYGELQRIIREEDPPRPSTRVGSRKQVLATVAAARAVLPTRLPGAIRGELDWIVMRAMEKDRSRRYDSAGSMARDIRRFLDGEPVQAAPPSTVYWLRKNLRRHRGPVAAAVLVLLALLGGLAGTSLGFFRAKAERAEAISQRTRADANALEANTERARADQRTIEALRSLESAQRQAYLANIGAAISALDSGEAQSARRRLDECPEPLRGWEWRHARSRLDTSIRVFSKAQFPSMVTEDIDISPDGRRFVTPWRDAGTGRWGARIADCETGAEVAVIPGHSGVVASARFSPDGARVLTAGEDG
ncbi:MAG: serine/threonine protein kinase, partial [Phycisphaerales bacterium]